MTAFIQGMGWVTPLGAGLEEVRDRLAAGEKGELRELAGNGAKYPYMQVPSKTVEALGRTPRLRRSSSITYFTAAAGLAALKHAGIEMTAAVAEKTALVFAVTDGGVVYTRKFYETIVKQGANAASPLLFPETVYNAPASHLAAVLGITGMTYTLVGDATVGLAALDFATQLLATTDLEQVVVAGGEEIDWVLCEAYRAWRLTGAPLAEGGAAVVLGRSGSVKLERVHPGIPFFRRTEAPGAILEVCRDLATVAQPAVVIAGANGTFIDAPERQAIRTAFPKAEIRRPKFHLGESIGAGAITQTIVGALALDESPTTTTAAVTCLGFNQQAAGALLTAAR